MSKKSALILAAAAGLLAAVLALLPVPGNAAEFVYRHRLPGIQTAALVADDAAGTAQDAVGLTGVRFISNWSGADSENVCARAEITPSERRLRRAARGRAARQGEQ